MYWDSKIVLLGQPPVSFNQNYPGNWAFIGESHNIIIIS
jgi:hypothetical protein